MLDDYYGIQVEICENGMFAIILRNELRQVMLPSHHCGLVKCLCSSNVKCHMNIISLGLVHHLLYAFIK